MEHKRDGVPDVIRAIDNIKQKHYEFTGGKPKANSDATHNYFNSRADTINDYGTSTSVSIKREVKDEQPLIRAA